MRVPRQPAYHPPAGSAAEPPEPPGRRRRRRGLRWIALGAALLVLAGALAGWLSLRGFDGKLTTDTGTARELDRHREERPARAAGKAENVLLIRSDAGPDGSPRRAEALVVLHLAGDGASATAVGVPRDLTTQIPACTGTDGTALPARRGALALSYESGGTACAIRTLERLTGIRIDHHLLIDFTSLGKVADAVGGVSPCTLDALARRVSSSGVLLNPGKLLPVLDALTSSITSDAELDSLVELYELVRRIRAVPEGGLQFLTVPLEGGLPAQPDANSLFTALRTDKEVDPAWGGDVSVRPADAHGASFCA
ncbi:LCP family protein [Streptomyces avicenniae]|uniref:LCP family protein n=1 Tax=Streptomyces avicenniae TaxID=500153 RepID=UPI00069A396E|nr:LCP family protein [Streptomyces avicenniae]